jgi:hypothetical protein
MIRTLQIPDSSHNFTISTTFDGVAYSILFTWNARVGRWFYRLLKSDGTEVHGDRKLVADIPLHNYLVDDDLPAGSLWSMTQSKSDPGLRDLGSDCNFMYVDEANVV